MRKELNGPNIRFGTFYLDIIGSHHKFADFTVIFVISKSEKPETIQTYARSIFEYGCKDIAFCGIDSNIWHNIFDITDIELSINEDNYATTWELENIKEIPDILSTCKSNVFIFCSDYLTVRKCHSLIVNAGYGFKVKYVGEEDSIAMPYDKTYTVLSIERKWYRVMSELDEDYLFPPEVFEEI